MGVMLLDLLFRSWWTQRIPQLAQNQYRGGGDHLGKANW